MAEVQLVTVVGVLGIILSVMFYNNLVSKRALQRAKQDVVPPGLLGKFAVHDGAVVGRVVAIDGDRIVLEQAGIRKTVPVSAATEQGHDVVLSRAPEA